MTLPCCDSRQIEATMFEYMFSADIFVEDMYRQVDGMVEHLGFHRPGPASVITDASDAHTIMCRLDRDISRAPTRLEVIQGTGSLKHWNGHNIMAAWRSQAHRAARFHNTVFVAEDLGPLRDELARRRVPTMYDDTLTFERVWIGLSPDNPTEYDGRHDAGLRIEILPRSAFPVEAEVPPRTGKSEPGAMTRVVDRSFVVDDIDEALRVLDTCLGWQAAGPVTEVRSGGYLEAVLACRLPRSAALRLRQPTGSQTAFGAFAQRWGAGPYSIGISAIGLDEKAELLRSAGVPFTDIGDGGDERRHLRVGADVVGGTVLEFVEDGA
jgi:hypothetical protein